MNNYDETYRKLSEQHTDKEIAEAMLIPASLSKEEQKEADRELSEYMRKIRSEMTEEQQIRSKLLQLKYRLENYIKKKDYDSSMGFGTQLEAYVKLLNRTKKEAAEELAVSYTKLSRIINQHDAPTIAFMHRLEAHSDGLVSALVWWKLWVKQQEYELLSDDAMRKTEIEKVTRAVNNRG